MSTAKYATRDNPSPKGVAITTSDSTEYDPCFRALYVGVAGNVSLVDSQDTTLVFVGVQAGTILPVVTKKVLAATTAASLIGLY